MELSVPNVYGLLIRSRLLAIADARAMYERWQKEAKDALNLSLFTKWLVTNRFLTEYQAALLARGHAEGFFLGQYKILDRLGRGRMAGVYKAVHSLGQVVAIKVLPPSMARDPQLLGRFQREARLVQKLKHPNVVRAYQMGGQQCLYYIVMEYLEGETLDEILERRTRLPPSEAVRLVYQVLLGLDHIQEQGFVHRDLKPANLMLVPAPTHGPLETTLGCTVKILDVGLARTLFEQNLSDSVVEQQLTSEGVLLGTPDYMAPEQARDARAADIRADIYSLGCVLYHTLSGQPPFPDTNVISQMVRHATEQPRPLRDFNPAIPDGLQQIIGRMMAKDQSQRYQKPDQAAQALQVFLAKAEKPAAPDANPQMRSYLTWLETEDKKVPVPPPIAQPAPGTSPEATPVAGTARPGGKHAKHIKHGTSGKHRGKKRKRHPPGLAGATVQAFDVELVPMPSLEIDAQAKPGGLRLTRRDFVMFGVGAVIVVVAIFLGWYLANKLGKTKTTETPVENATNPE